MQKVNVAGHTLVKGVFAVLTLAAAGGAHAAGACEAPFMHNGGSVRYQGSGNLQLGADLAFSEVTRSDATNCRARVQGTATFSYAGLPPSQSRLDYLMTIRQGQATFVRYDKAGGAPGDDGPFDLRMLGLFGYETPITKAGQRFPGGAYRLKIGKDAPIQGGGAAGTTVRIGEKTVGQQATIDTALGRQACWPVTYDRNSDPTFATLGSITLPIPALITRVTDWYCPKPGLVMKQEINQAGSISTVQITQIK